MTFEYKTTTVNCGDAELSRLGRLGWELVAVAEGRLYFKKQIKLVIAVRELPPTEDDPAPRRDDAEKG